MKVLVLYNYDSFMYNLVDLIKLLTTGDVDVVRNDQLPIEKAGNFIIAKPHKKFDIQGVQFHPESVLTPCGKTIMANGINNN